MDCQAIYAAEIAQKKAASDMAYDIVKAQTQQKLIEETQKIKIVEAQKAVELQAEITKPAEAEQSRIRILAQAELEKRKILAQADAEAAKLRASGEAEAMTKKADAYKLYNDAAMASMIIEKLPDLVNAAASPLSKIGQMTVLTTGGESGGASRITGDILNVAAQSLTLVKGLTGIDLAANLKKENGNGDHNKVVSVEQGNERQ